MITVTGRYDSPVGRLVISADGERGTLCAVLPEAIHARRFDCEAEGNDPVIEMTRDWLDRYFAGMRPLPSELPLSPEGTPFSRTVWDILLTIPYGEVTTYGAIARKIAAARAGDSIGDGAGRSVGDGVGDGVKNSAAQGEKRMSAQAVGGAVGRNPIAIIIPCHRVIGSNRTLVGFAGGLDMKLLLLRHEGADIFVKV